MTTGVNKEKALRLGYFVPEFPGQTHMFFWREIERLEALGVVVRIVSTRTPPKNITSHSWSDAAKARTNYLGRPGLATAFELMLSALRFSPRRWTKVFASIFRSGLGFKGKIELLGLALFGARLANLARKEAWDHLHVHSCANAANVALFASLLSDLPYSVTLHGPLEDYGPNQDEKWSHAAFGIVITQKLFADVRGELCEAATRRLNVAPMGVNLNVFARQKPYEVWDGTAPARLYTVGRLNICKGHDHLIEAVGILKSRGLPVLLQIAGEDESGGTGYHKELDQLVHKLNLRNEVKLLGAVSERVVREGLENSNLFTLASLHEPLGVAIMEAMALEMPVVVTGSGGVKELVDDGIDGKLVDPSDPYGLADAIETLLKDPDQCLRLAAASRSKIAAGFQDTRSAEVLLSQIALSSKKQFGSAPTVSLVQQQAPDRVFERALVLDP